MNPRTSDASAAMSTKQDGPRSSVLLRRLIDNAPRCGGENDTDQRRNDPRWHGYFLEVERRKSDYLHVVGKAISCDVSVDSCLTTRSYI